MDNSTRMITQLSLTVKFNLVLFPFDVVAFLRALTKQGYILSEQFDPTHPLTLGARLEVKGPIGRRGDAQVRLETERQLLGTYAPDTGTLLSEFESLESLVKDEFGLDGSQIAQYYEFLAGLTIRANKNPLASWRYHFAGAPLLKRFSEVLGKEVAPFGLRITPAETNPNQADWFDIQIRPQVQSPTSHHQVEVIWRHPERAKVYEFVRKFDSLIGSLLLPIEEG